jgi:glycogen(starch) synthase
MARGVPAVTSDLSGFGAYVLKHQPELEDQGVMVCRRRWASYNEAADQLTNWLAEFTKMNRRERIAVRNQVEQSSDHFDWHNLARHYDEAHSLALERI